ncbi:hypothetical protein PG995_015690 [Apiospora arundinis]|uniref:Uncharacterized protein n=1 Tax=Apiospora arundinis TaxID=335852 RepID=A0ABR2IEL2_9PEZI
MSNPGGGGVYRYRCRCFYSHNCPNWTYVNNTCCTQCVAAGHDTQAATQEASWYPSKEISIPRVENGVLDYTLMEIVAGGQTGNEWTLRPKVDFDQPPAGGHATTTSAVPNAPVIARGN